MATKRYIYHYTKFITAIDNSLKGIYLGLYFPYSFRVAVDTYIKNDGTKIYDLYFEQNTIKHLNRKVGDFSPNIIRQWNC